MKRNEFLKKIKKQAKINERNRKDLRFLKAMNLLKAKGLLDTNLPIKEVTGMKCDLQDVIWAGKNVEPRILEVLPAAILHYRSNFLGLNEIPENLNEVLKAIRFDKNEGPMFEGIPFEKMKTWANFNLRDRRTKPLNEQKVPKYFKLHIKSLNKIAALVAAGIYKDQTSAIEAAIEKL